MITPTRRTFNQSLLGTLAAYGLIETLFDQDAFAESVKPVIEQWMTDLNTLSKDLKADRKKHTTILGHAIPFAYRIITGSN